MVEVEKHRNGIIENGFATIKKFCFKAIYLLLFFTFICISTYSQSSQYFKNFDFYKMQGVDTLKNTDAFPKFFIKCSYDNSGRVIGIDASRKANFDHLFSTIHISVLDKNDQTLLFLGAGKTRDGYTRGLFQQKIYETDTALITNDTLIYKKTSKNYIRVQYFTNINSDSIIFTQVVFPFNSKKDIRTSKLSSFAYYKDWFTIADTSVSQIVSGVINLRSDPILLRKKIKSDYYINLLNITKSTLANRPDMPITLFWLKNSGLLN